MCLFLNFLPPCLFSVPASLGSGLSRQFYIPLPLRPLPVGSPPEFDYSHNYTIFDHGKLFPQITWQVQICLKTYRLDRVEAYKNTITQLPSHPSPLRPPARAEGYEIVLIDLNPTYAVAKFELPQVSCGKSWTGSKIV